jgi:hypothetical protein
MHTIRRAVLSVATFLAAAVPAAAQTTSGGTDTGPSLLWVWVWILVAGIIIFIVGTSIGSGQRR